MGKYNDLDLSQWREYTDIETDSLWIIDKRDNSGAHSGHYHGNFVPQIPHQLFLDIPKRRLDFRPIYGKWNIINRSTTHGEKFNWNRNST